VSAVVLRDEEPIYSEPSAKSPRRGTAIRAARLPLFGARLGPGCAKRWLFVGPNAWICEDGATPSSQPPLALDAPVEATPLGLPHRYFFVSKEGSFGYRELETAEAGAPDVQYQPGFGVAITRVSPKKETGDPFGLTSRGFWVPMRDLHAAPAVEFRGVSFSGALGWVRRDGTPVYSAPGRRKPGTSLARHTVVGIQEVREHQKKRYLRVDEKEWLLADDVIEPRIDSPPPEIRPGERWIDVDLSRQTLVVHMGDRPVYATLVSTGSGPVGTPSATPKGTYRIWVKLETSDMDNLEDVEARANYAIEAVPWVMFFHQGYGLHGTFWHDRFGETRSHGCVNLSPRDAERVFHWTSPKLYPGWSAVHPTAHEPGTLVRIR